MNPRSYDINTSHRDIDSEVERLRVQALSSWKKELRNLVWFGLQDGMSVLEPGSGPGFITEQLLKSFPRVQVTAVEIDQALVRKARLSLKGQLGERLQVVNASIMETGLQENTFDFAVARLIFQHLPNPNGAAREMLRVLKPGGKLVIIDSDDAMWGLADPAIPEMVSVLEKYGQAQAVQGGNRLVGRQLWRILENAGFVNLHLEAVIVHSDELGIEAFASQLDPDRLLPLAEAGLISEQQVQHFSASSEDFFAATRPIIAMLIFMASGQKP